MDLPLYAQASVRGVRHRHGDRRHRRQVIGHDRGIIGWPATTAPAAIVTALIWGAACESVDKDGALIARHALHPGHLMAIAHNDRESQTPSALTRPKAGGQHQNDNKSDRYEP